MFMRLPTDCGNLDIVETTNVVAKVISKPRNMVDRFCTRHKVLCINTELKHYLY